MAWFRKAMDGAEVGAAAFMTWTASIIFVFLDCRECSIYLLVDMCKSYDFYSTEVSDEVCKLCVGTTGMSCAAAMCFALLLGRGCQKKSRILWFPTTIPSISIYHTTCPSLVLFLTVITTKELFCCKVCTPGFAVKIIKAGSSVG